MSEQQIIKRKTYTVSLPTAHTLSRMSVEMSEANNISISRQDLLDAAVKIISDPKLAKKVLKIVTRNKTV